MHYSLLVEGQGGKQLGSPRGTSLQFPPLTTVLTLVGSYLSTQIGMVELGLMTPFVTVGS